MVAWTGEQTYVRVVSVDKPGNPPRRAETRSGIGARDGDDGSRGRLSRAMALTVLSHETAGSEHGRAPRHAEASEGGIFTRRGAGDTSADTSRTPISRRGVYSHAARLEASAESSLAARWGDVREGSPLGPVEGGLVAVECGCSASMPTSVPMCEGIARGRVNSCRFARRGSQLALIRRQVPPECRRQMVLRRPGTMMNGSGEQRRTRQSQL